MVAIVFITSRWKHLRNPEAGSKAIGMSKGFTIFLGAAELAGSPGVIFGVLAVSRELWFQFVALLFRLGCPTHLIVLRFADAFFEHLRTLAPSLGIFIFSERVCCLPSG